MRCERESFRWWTTSMIMPPAIGPAAGKSLVCRPVSEAVGHLDQALHTLGARRRNGDGRAHPEAPTPGLAEPGPRIWRETEGWRPPNHQFRHDCPGRDSRRQSDMP